MTTLLTIKDLEKILQVQAKTVRKYVKNGDLKAFKLNKKILVKEEDLEEFLNSKGDDLRMTTFLTTKDLAEILQVQAKTVREYVKSGELKAFKLNKKILVKEEDLEEFLNRKIYKVGDDTVEL